MKLITGAVVACAVSSAALAGPDWIELGDAGSIFGSAQVIVGIGSPVTIQGSLNDNLIGSDLEDLYILKIDQPMTFKFDQQFSSFDSNLWLFNVTLANQLFGLLANDDGPLGQGALINGPMASDGSGAMVLNPGIYALGITGGDRRPVSSTGDIFSLANPLETSGPDGPGGINAHNGWVGDGETGSYLVMLEGIGYVDVPAPGAGALLGMGALCTLRRRRPR